MSATVKGPAPNPCGSCPYRCDAPSGVWHPDEYAKLTRYDQPTYAQPPGLFLCHQTASDDSGSRLCAGWVACHGDQLLALRLAAVDGRLDPDTATDCFDYTTAVPIFDTGAQACAHGITDIHQPTAAVVVAVKKIAARRDDIHLEEPA